MIPDRTDPEYLLSVVKDWVEDCEYRLEDARISLKDAIKTYNRLPPGYGNLELEKRIEGLSRKLW
jgi:hypothetical protein